MKKDIMQDKRPRNEKGEGHGRWVVYYNNGTLWYKAFYIKTKLFGYYEYRGKNYKTIIYYAR